MAVRTEELQLRVVIDGTPARRELAMLDQEYAQLNSAMKDLKKGSQEWIAAQERVGQIGTRQAELRKEIGLTSLTAKQLGDELRRLQVAQRNLTPNTPMWAENAARIEQVKGRLKELNDVNLRSQAAWEVQRRNIKLTEMTMEQLELESRRLAAQLRTMDPNTREFVNLRRELTIVEQRMTSVRSGLGPFGRMWAEVKGQVVGAGAVLGTLFAGGAFLNGIRSAVRGAAELSDAQADVQRTTGLTKSEVNELTRSLGRFNTRTPRLELLQLASEAGKLGITGTDNIMKFVRAGDQIKVALGEDLGEDAIKNIGKLNQSFDVGRKTGKDLEQQMLATGSAINTLEQSSTAEANYLVGYTNRLAGANQQAEINIQNTLGYAAALDQLAQTEETAATAMTQFTLGAFRNTAEYAKIAGMEVGAFARLLKEDANEALLRTLEGLKGNNDGLTGMVARFGLIDQEGARAVSVLASLANNTDLVRQQQAIANKEFERGTSITNEFNAKNTTLGANLEIIGKKLGGLFVSSGLVQGLTKLSQGLREMVSPTIADGIEEERQALMRMYSQVLMTNEGSSERIKLINEMKAMYPGLLEGLNAETATNKQLGEAVRAANEQLINRIIIQQKQEEIDKNIARQAAQRMDRLSMEDNVLKKLEAAERKYNVERQAGNTILEQAQRTYALIYEAQQKELNGRSAGGVWVNDVARLGNAINGLRAYYGQEHSQILRGNQLLAEKEALMKRLGVTMKETAAQTATAPQAVPEAAGRPGAPAGPDNAAQQKLQQQRDAMEQLRKDLMGLREQMLVDAMSADGRELEQVAKKYDDIRAAMAANGLATTEDFLALEDAREAALLQKLDEQGQRRIEKAREQALAEQQARQDAQDEVYLDQQVNEADAEIVREMQRLDQLVAVYEQAGIDTQGIVERSEKAIAAIRKKYRDQERTAALEDRKQRITEQVAIYQGVSSTIGGVNALLAAAYDASGRANYEQTKGAKALGLAQIAISSGIGVAEAIKAGSGVPFPGNLAAIATGVGAVLTGIANAMNLLKNARVDQPGGSSNNSPRLATPTTMPYAAKGGIFDGPSHDMGGLHVVDPRSGQVKAVVEGDEPWMVLSKAFRAANPDLLPVLMQASAQGTPLRVVHRRDPAANQGIFGEVKPFNFAQADKVLEMANGGVMQQGRATAAPNAAPEAAVPVASPVREELVTQNRYQAEQLQVMYAMLEALSRDRQSYVVLEDLERRKVEWKNVQNLNRVKKVA